MNSNGYILFEGPSMLDGSPIVVIATGLKRNSKNSKTGAMVQTYIIRTDMKPTEARKSGADSAICGDCVHRKGTCYVNLGQGPRAVFDGYQRGIYPNIQAENGTYPAEWLEFNNRAIRFGTYGDPMAAPVDVWERLDLLASTHTGYTHQWREADTTANRWTPLVMASADTVQDAQDAHALGFRTFRVADEKMKGETLCPASEQAGRKIDCVKCGACNGAQGRKGSIFIPLHGGFAVMANKEKFENRLIAKG